MTDLLKKTKVTELEKKIPDVSNLATTNAVTAVKNKITSTSSLVKKKTDYGPKISEFEKKLTDHDHDKYVTISKFNALAASVFNARLAQAKTDFDAKLSSQTEKLLQIKKAFTC